jgi:succinate dehydrogenase / fumarate reductase flavoprotein subunit
MSILDSKIPEGPISDKWTDYKDHLSLVAPNNRPKIDIIVVGTGLAGAAAAASLGEMGYNVKAFCFQDSPRRAHSIAAQGGINAAKNYQNDGDSVYRLFYDTIKGGDYRAREANVHRLAEVSGTSSINVWLKGFLLLVNTVVYWITVHLVERKFNVRFMPLDKLDNNYY